MKKIHIPPAALEAGWKAVANGNACCRTSEQIARAAFEAMVAEWPGMDTIMLPRMMQPGHFVPQDYIRLPLTEKQDDKA